MGTRPARFTIGIHDVQVTPSEDDALSLVTTVLPARADGPVRIVDRASSLGVAFTLRGAAAAPIAIADGLAVYPHAAQNADVVHHTHAGGTEDFYFFEQRPAAEELVYDVDVAAVAGLRLVNNTLEFLDRGGAPRLRIASPYVIDAAGKHVGATLAVGGCAYDTNLAGPWGRSVVPPGAGKCSVRVSWQGITYPAIVDPAWSATADMTGRRANPATALLASGKVLVAGGASGTPPMPGGAAGTAELYDPATKTFAATGALGESRYGGHRLVELASGKVLLVGAADKVARLYDPTSGTFSLTGSLLTTRGGVDVARLKSGKVIVSDGGASPTMEIFDPATATFSSLATTGTFPAKFTMTLLPSGSVLFVGDDGPAVVYDPAAGSFKSTGAPVKALGPHGATLASASGKVLVNGAESLELFDPQPGTFTAVTAKRARGGNQSTLLLSGKLLMTGAYDPFTEIFDADKGTFEPGPKMLSGRSQHFVLTLKSGQVLAAGGEEPPVFPSDETHSIKSAEVLDLAPLGVACMVDPDCANGHCVEGICCDAVCAGGCDTCKATGQVGTCTVLPAKSEGTPACAPFVCDGVSGACPTACKVDTDCADGSECSAAQVCIKTGTCDGSHTTTALDGTTRDCAPYNCQTNGRCKPTCESIDDCVRPNVCDASGACIPPVASEDDSGGCSTAGNANAGLGTLLLVASAMASSVVRRRRRRCASSGAGQ